MQPTYLPWAGYFNLMAQVDDFVFLDDVQFERRSWQSRNRILLDGHEHLLTVPVRKSARDTRLDAIELASDDGWRDAHARLLEAAYGRAPFGREGLEPVLGALADRTIDKLADLTVRIIEGWRSALGLSARTHRASALGCGGSRSEHLALICQALGTRDYLSPAGSETYLTEDRFISRFNMHLSIQSFLPSPYTQMRTAQFVSHLSLLDVIAHLGIDGANRYIRGESA